MREVLEVREFDVITYNKEYENSPYFQYLEECHFKELERFIKDYTTETNESDALDFMKIGFRRNVGDIITLNSNVGIIELPSGFQIEVLPKISFDKCDGETKDTKRIFLNMLRCLREFEGKAFNNASLNAQKMNLYEVFINMYLQETRNLVKHGIKASYIAQEDNLSFYKGKLLVSEQIKKNAAHKEKFYMQYDEYQVNRAENRLVKATLLKLQKQTNSSENIKEIRQILSAFELVDASINYEKDFAAVTINRNTKDYELLMQWSKVFLLNKSFTSFSGDKIGKALLFPMERIFEAYVAKWMKQVFGEYGYSVSVQDSGYWLFDKPRKFRLRPDIVVRKNDITIIMDTKWKRLTNSESKNFGISQADMYQMYAYSQKYSKELSDGKYLPEVWILYPLNSEVIDMQNKVFKSEDGVVVHIYFIDVAHIDQSLYELRTKVEQVEYV